MAVFAEIEVLNILNHEILGVPHFHDPNSKGTNRLNAPSKTLASSLRFTLQRSRLVDVAWFSHTTQYSGFTWIYHDLPIKKL